MHTDVHLGSAYIPLHFGLSLCNLLQHVWLPYPRRKGTSIALIWGIVGLYECCIYREIKCRNFPSDPASYQGAHWRSRLYNVTMTNVWLFAVLPWRVLVPWHVTMTSPLRPLLGAPRWALIEYFVHVMARCRSDFWCLKKISLTMTPWQFHATYRTKCV